MCECGHVCVNVHMSGYECEHTWTHVSPCNPLCVHVTVCTCVGHMRTYVRGHVCAHACVCFQGGPSVRRMG